VKRASPLQPPILVETDAYEDAISPSLSVGKSQNVDFTADEKDEYEVLESPIHRKWGRMLSAYQLHLNLAGLLYINAYGHEIYPSPNPDYIANLSSSEVLVYSCGSLWTR
jgi:hypothetical protein